MVKHGASKSVLRQEDSTCTKPVARVNEIHSVAGITQKPIFGGLV